MPKVATHFRAPKRPRKPTISCVNKSTTPFGVEFNKLIRILQEFVDKHYSPVWKTPCTLVHSTGKVPKGHWALVFVDDLKRADAEGWHDLTPDGLPLAKVFVKVTLKDKDKVSVTASHELAEMLVDPGIQLGAEGPRSTWYAYETADAVEDQFFKIDGVPMTNFVYPAWFESFHEPNATTFDHMGLCTHPFQILQGGYMSVRRGSHWSEVGPSHTEHKSLNRGKHPRAAFRSDPSAAIRSNPSLGA
jgi:hypothetical protein